MKKILLASIIFILCFHLVAAQLEVLDTISDPKSQSVTEDIISESKSLSLEEVLEIQSNNFIDKKLPVIVHLNKKFGNLERKELLSLGSEIKYEYSLINAVALSIDNLKLKELKLLGFVKFVEYDAETKIVLAQSTIQIGASRVWLEHNVDGAGINVAVLDTGIDNEHPDLNNVIKEQDFTGEGTDDEQGHGTHVASTVAGSGASSGGVNKGVAPGAKLMDVKVLNSQGSGRLSDTIAGIEWAVLNEADVISMSLGAQIPCNGLDATSLVSDAAVKRGVVVVVAAGNLGPLPGTIGSPGCAKEVITVGAVDRLDNIAVFSSRGPTLDGRVKPDIVAPGVLIIAAKNGGSYTALSGTSMATPHVSGVVALMLSENKNLAPEQIKNVLMETAKDLSVDKYAQGSGRVDAYLAFIESSGLEPKDEPKREVKDEPKREVKDEEDAKKRAKESGKIDKIDKVGKDSRGKKDYYVVRGINEEEPKKKEVWVNQESGEVDFVEEVGFVQIIIRDFTRFWKGFFKAIFFFL